MTTPDFPLVGNLLCLDLVNTEPMREGGRVDLLDGYPALVAWLQAAGALSEEAARRALTRWNGHPEAEAALREAKALRLAIRRGVERVLAGAPAGAGMVRAVNRVLEAAPTRTRVVRQDGRLVTRREPVRESAVQLLAPVAESAAWLLEHGDPALLHRCAGDECVLVFYDTTRNHSRRWCSMETCGSRAKAGAYYRRQRAVG